MFIILQHKVHTNPSTVQGSATSRKFNIASNGAHTQHMARKKNAA